MQYQEELALRRRFGLSNGQIRDYRYRNLIWTLKGVKGNFGCGDLSDDDIIRIAGQLKPGEVFVGWNEHHGSEFQQTDHPMIKITNTSLMLREDILKAAGAQV